MGELDGPPPERRTDWWALAGCLGTTALIVWFWAGVYWWAVIR